ncbi:MAG: PIN domain-containing protein [Acidobacteria bacterium]|nr:PIN domain-containing protein [Acidobacteriota bacterium]MYJ05962.1 PIN domain-containing protein [Acidobacteriota bacterium]
MSVDCFLDTNVFVYQLEGRDTRKAAIAHDLIRQGIESGNACISFQVVQECLNTALRKALVPLGSDDMRRYVDSVLAPLLRVQPSLRLYHASLDIHSRYGFAYYDALIVAAALDAGCSVLYSEDLQDRQRIDGLTVVDPFGSSVAP